MIDKDQFYTIFPNAVDGSYGALTKIAIPKADLSTPARLRYFLAQCGHESGGFARLEENLRYTSADRVRRVFRSAFANASDAIPYLRKPQKLANRVYAGKYGNGDERSGDGWRYRGRGWIGLTFAGNYRSFFEWAGMPDDTSPDLVATVEGAALSSAWYWTANEINPLCDEGDFVGVTKKINPPLAGLDDRERLLALIEKEGI